MMENTMEEQFHGITISSEAEMAQAVEAIFQFAEGRNKFALTGDLGAGKTTFTQHFCKKIGVKERVTSPTFALVNEYAYTNGQGEEKRCYHLDLYRLNDLQEALEIGIEDYLYDENYCFVEWPEIVEPMLPDEVVRIKMTILPDSSRKILFL